MKPVGKQNQTVRRPELKDFPVLFLKILPAALVIAGLEACHNTSVSANSAPSKAPVVAPAGSVLRVRLDQALDTRHSRPGDRFTGELDSPLMADGKEILPKGTIVSGHVLTAHSSDRLGGPAALSLVLESCRVNGKALALDTDTVTRVNGRHQRNWTLIDGGAGLYSGPGSVAGRPGALPAGDSADAASGGSPKGSGSAITGKREVFVPAETVVGFTLNSPLSV